MWTIREIEDWHSVAHFLAGELEPGDWVWIEGELGAGKTHLVREIMKELGFSGVVQSPSYPLMLNYELEDYEVAHIDGFRMQLGDESPWDIEALEDSLVFVEWPKNTNLPLEKFNYRVEIQLNDDQTRSLRVYRNSKELRDLN